MKMICFVNPTAEFLISANMPEGWTYSIVSSEVEGDAYVESALKEAADADFYLVGLEWIGKELIAPAKNLKLIQRLGAGYDNVDLACAKELGVPVANIPGANSVAVAEHAIMVIIALLKRLAEADRSMKDGEWKLTELLFAGCYELWQKTVGIVGLGMIGKALAQRLTGFDVNVIYNDILDFPPELEKDLQVTRVSFEELLQQSDVVTMHVPLTDLTRDMMSTKQFEMMQSTALFVNSARGEVVDEAALAEALNRGIISGAAIDVFKDDPPKEDNPLLKADNILLTPHVAGVTREVSMRFISESFANFDRVADGKPPENVISVT
jgi:phosphoglycerate dehydrogenase-like enzyme